MRTSNTIFSVRALYSWLTVSVYLTDNVSLVILKDTPTGNSFPDFSVVGVTEILACELHKRLIVTL